MAIILEKEQKQKKDISFSLPTWIWMILIIVLIFGTISYFLFFGKEEKVELKESKEGLTKEEIKKIAALLTEIENPVFQRLIVIVPQSTISEPIVDTSRLGKSNPFLP